jgi:hypothetical protein
MDSNLNVQSPHLLKDDNNCLLPPENAAQKFLHRTIEVMIRKNISLGNYIKKLHPSL